MKTCVKFIHLKFLIIDFCIFLVVLIEKYFKNFKVCDCFLDIVCYCLDISADFPQFGKYCVELKGWNDIFITKNTSRTSGGSPFHETYVACCKKFADFQIDLFVKPDSFPLRRVYCRYSWARADTDFDYKTDDFLEIYYNSDSDSNNDNDSNERTNCFSSSICYAETRANLISERFCLSCQNTFLI